jgi:hypothetical protein
MMSQIFSICGVGGPSQKRSFQLCSDSAWVRGCRTPFYLEPEAIPDDFTWRGKMFHLTYAAHIDGGARCFT